MRSEDLYSAIGNMDDRYIDDRPIGEVKESKRLPLWSKLVAVAACIALVLTGVTAGKQGTADIVYPTCRAPSSDADYASGDLNMGPFYLNYADLAALADIVVVADVVNTFSENSSQTDTVRLSYADVRVRTVLKGRFRNGVRRGKTICVQDGLYIENDTVVSYSGGPYIETGQRVLLFLAASDGTDKTAAGTAYFKQATPYIGAFFYDRDGCYHAASSYNENGGGTYRLTEQPVRSLRSLRRQMQKKHRTMREDEYEMHKNMTDIVYGWY